MDPILAELMQGPADTELEALIKLRGGQTPPAVTLVSRFGSVATCRLRRGDIQQVWSDPRVVSLKAPRLLDALHQEPLGLGEANDTELRATDLRRPDNLQATGAGCVFGVVDFGCDFAHPNLRDEYGRTRLLALWDQRGQANPASPAPYGYGRLLTRAAIDVALEQDDPYTALDYDSADVDAPPGAGAHGTHVLDIAAGNGRLGGSPLGVAPGAELIFVHLANSRVFGLSDLGDSVRILEALDFIHRTAGKRPCVINTSLGSHSGSHKGESLLEQGMDALLLDHPGRAITQSCGNYYRAATHASGRIGPGQERTLTWITDAADRTPNEFEVWYEGRDRLLVEVFAPNSQAPFRARQGETVPLIIDGEGVGRLYHRASDPGSGDHHVDLFLSPDAPAGAWRLRLSADEVVDGRFHAWIERDSGCRSCQTRFVEEDAEPTTTTGTICNGFQTLAVGAYDAHREGLPLVSASSAGPTRDGRTKPDLIAPGGAILAARSHPRTVDDAPLLTRKTGTSMAAPHVAGTLLLMFEAAGRLLPIAETRRALLGELEPVEAGDQDRRRLGGGRLNIAHSVERATALGHLPAGDDMAHFDNEPDDSLFPETPPLDDIQAHSENTLSEATNRNFILVSGGPGLFDDRDDEHDKSWANYVTPPLLLSDGSGPNRSLGASDEEVWWFIYKPAYVRRWEDDVKHRRKSVKEVRDKGFSSYVDLLEGRAKSRGWNLRWLEKADELWSKLKTFSDPISRLWYWGHARDGLWLTLAHSSSATPVAPDSHEIIAVDDIKDNATSKLKKSFRAGSSARRHRFLGCNSDNFAKVWAKTFAVETEGFKGVILFDGIHATDGEPTLKSGTKRKWFAAGGSSQSAPSEEQDDGFLDSALWPDKEIPASSQPLWQEMMPVPALEVDSAFLPTASASAPSAQLHEIAANLPLVDRADGVMETGEAAARFMDAALGLYGAANRTLWENDFEILGGPGETLSAQPERGDLLIERALDEGGLARLSVVEAQDTGGMIRIRRIDNSRRCAWRLRGSSARPRLPGNAMLLRPWNGLDGDGIADILETESVLHHCRPGEGPPAALPDPEGRGLHPLVYRGSDRRRSRNPTVGDAQWLLNKFLSALDSGGYHCRTGADLAAIGRMRATLSPALLRVDCRFGPQTDTATRIFQRCVFPGQREEWDGKIGPLTWAELERLRPAPIITPPPLRPPTSPPVPDNVRELLQRIQDALESLKEWIPDAIENIVCPGIKAPSRLRFLDPAEQAEARTVYGASLDFSHILITDGLGCGGRPFTVAFPVSGDWWIAMNQGSIASFATRPRSDTLIHELAHAWQSQHHGSDPTAFMQNSMINQAAAAAMSAMPGGEASAYAYIPGKPFGEYAAEQIAEQIEDSYNSTGSPTPAIVSHVSSVASGVADAANQISLTVMNGFERRSTAGVIWP
ncbi:S8 family peptidase [Halomonas sp. M20]|uniref:S8 family peptidase n=1 Tax=Halomonas sp. M20 TaxID=2763264 RepID=UPI001D0A1C36|nr:S8 family peptidase [Halomonas sp. M20]